MPVLPLFAVGRRYAGNTTFHQTTILRMRRLPVVNDRPGVIERAFQVAKSGKVSNIKDLQTQLAEEGYSNLIVVLSGRSLRQQISRMIVEARTASN